MSARRRRKIREVAGETGIPWVDQWLSKVGTAEQKILRFIAERYPLVLTDTISTILSPGPIVSKIIYQTKKMDYVSSPLEDWGTLTGSTYYNRFNV